MQNELPLLLSDYDASDLLGLSRATLWRRVSDGTLPQPVRIGGGNPLAPR
ncbi:MAG: putative DNA-binding transcriptional regulator AlpA [Paracoccaceae bacterium]|jgi:predicted DNA-binding transcriptional regulator AlpA